MIELKHICRTYKVKGAPEVKALDDVSLVFGERGLVFILGKSGSGKTTMLNVIGGLDRYDSGDLVILGKSSKDFKQSDFDAYRNTFLGFIFQEYNILEEYTVGKNIALALQLQGKKGSKEEIDEILDEVDLHGLAARKPNELSGGQKQRVAIARALVKKPQIIMADEPTGALDSKTGMAVFATLKKLSLTHLVIVVSHDRDFAEAYGDRVIELKDGKVISDISKHEEAPSVASAGLLVSGDRLLTVKAGYTLTEDDVRYLTSFFSTSKCDVILSRDPEVNRNTKAASKIGDNGEQIVFAPTKEKDIGSIAHDPKDFHLLKSHLPFVFSLGMGASSLKSKPFRLVLTLLLLTVSFTLFGIADTLVAYDGHDQVTSSLLASASPTVAVSNRLYSVTSHGAISYQSSSALSLEPAEIEAASQKYGMSFKGVSLLSPALGYATSSISYTDQFDPDYIDSLYSDSLYSSTASFGGCVDINQSELDGLNLALVAGTLPVGNDEVAISELAYKHFQKYGYKRDSSTSTVLCAPGTLASEQDFLAVGPTLDLESVGLAVSPKIVAVIETGFNEAHYADLNKTGTDMATWLRRSGLVSDAEDNVDYSYTGFLFSAEGSGGFRQSRPDGASFSFMVAPKTEFAATRALINDSDYALSASYSGERFHFNSYVVSTFANIDEIIKTMGTVFFWIGFVFCVFASLMMLNYVATSISYKKREIGILRAVGASGLDIYGIFLNESLIIAFATWIFSSVAAGLISAAINSSLSANFIFHVNLFAFGWRQLLLVLVVAAGVAAVSSFIPCMRTSLKKPVDAIANR